MLLRSTSTYHTILHVLPSLFLVDGRRMTQGTTTEEHISCTPQSFPHARINSRFALCAFAGSARPSLHKTPSSRGSRGVRRGRTACRGIQCRMMSDATDDEGRPTKGFAQPQESRKTTPRGKGKVRAPIPLPLPL